MNKQLRTIVNNSCRRQIQHTRHPNQIFHVTSGTIMKPWTPVKGYINQPHKLCPYISLRRLLNFTIMKLKHHKHILKPRYFQVRHSHPPAQLISFSIFCFVSSLNGLLLAYICQGKNSEVLMIQREM